MYTKQPRERLSRDKVRGARIGRKHALFDDSVCVVVIALSDGLNFAVLLAHNLRFGCFKINCSAFFARRAEGFKELIKRLNILQIRSAFERVGRITAQGFVHGRVG